MIIQLEEAKHTLEGYRADLTELAEDVIHSSNCSISLVSTPCIWKGVTYREDREAFRQYLLDLVEKGEYPASLWENEVSPA